ncbi:hypothetical protein FB45DRAFT_930085 [Roridomyces roridus]|uniref:Uncharacterized protein n=1 Tax=Roridomyces roridus TaxID=1738132 RepID=A0AAD7AXU3_9AGAR|nr:hypothetical protein FB45DRAFT_965402 [Roridomyces roridus]KAJ7609272.1 hypothetical protein FB45DRAFT_944896 [Roridomyces roridus]KAJ7620376.1 hypothetical protein FB45DRAFT_930085 [Roridomyces roridus]
MPHDWDDCTYQEDTSSPLGSDVDEPSQAHQMERDERESEMSPRARAAARAQRLDDARERNRFNRRLLRNPAPLLQQLEDLARSPTRTRPPPRSSALDGSVIIKGLYDSPGALDSQTGDGTYIEHLQAETPMKRKREHEPDLQDDTLSHSDPNVQDDTLSQSERDDLAAERDGLAAELERCKNKVRRLEEKLLEATQLLDSFFKN